MHNIKVNWTNIRVIYCKVVLKKNLATVKLMKSREIFFDGQIVRLESILEEDKIVLTESEYPGIVYTSLQCTYADSVVELLQTFFEIFLYGVNSHEKLDYPDIKMYTKNWLISAYFNFTNIKTPIVKMIDKLFSYLDQIKILRTSDQSLLKSLLSINLFLYNSQNNNPIVTNDQNDSAYIINDNDFDQTIINVRSLNKSIVEMIGFVERFRSKRCVVLDPYKYNHIVNVKLRHNLILDVRNIQKLIKPTLKTINVLINKGSKNYDDFNKNKFDPEYLLFENLLSHNNGFLGNIQVVLNGNPSDLISVYLNVKNTLNMKHVLEFQHTLIEVISEVFYTQIYSLSMKTLDRTTIRNLMELQAKFKQFVYYMMPSNCSINVCNKILKYLVFLDKTLADFNNKKSTNILIKLGEHFGPAMNLQLINQNYQPNLFESSTLPLLFHMMWGDPQYETFKRVVRLLSYESFTNSDFNISNVFNHVGMTSSQSHDIPLMNDMVELQYALFAFWALLKTDECYQISNTVVNYTNADLNDLNVIGFSTPKSGTGKRKKGYIPITLGIISIVVKLYLKYYVQPAVKNILLPFLIHFKHNENYSSPKSPYEISITLQMSSLTISLIENFLIRNYSFTFYSILLYNTFIINSDIGRPHTNKLKYDLNSYAENSDMNIGETLAFLNSLYYDDFYNKFFQKHDREIEFVWNGSKHSGYNIFQTVLIGITDFNDLIRLQWFGVKWFVSKIVLNLYNTAQSFTCGTDYHNTFEHFKFKLNEFSEVEFPKSIKLFLDDIFKSTLITLNVNFKDLCGTNFSNLATIFTDSFSVLDAHPTDNNAIFAESQNYMKAMISKFELLKIYSESNFLGTQNTLNSTDLGLSPLTNNISVKIIKILFNVD